MANCRRHFRNKIVNVNMAILNSVVLPVLFRITLFSLSNGTEVDANDEFNVDIGIQDCGVKEGLGCLGFSIGCIEENNCEILATYQVRKSGDVTFTISGIAGQNQYLALALAEDNVMGNDGAIVCYHKEGKLKTPREPGQPARQRNTGILVSWNQIEPERKSIVVDKPGEYLVNRSSRHEDGKLWCTFTLRKVTSILNPLRSSEINVIELYRPYFLQLVKGDFSTVRGKITLLHHEISMSTDSKVDFKQTAAPAQGKKRKIIKAHASLMVIAWMFFAEIGTFTAGYFRTRFPENAGAYWFHIHQFSMCITWILSIVSASLMYISIGFRPLDAELLKTNPHALVGLLGLIVTCAQPIMGFLRPDPYSNRRPLFNNVHKYLGILATGLALTAIILSSFLVSAMLSRYTAIGPVSFVFFYIAAHFFLKKVKLRGMTFCVRFGYFCGIAGLFLFMLAYLTVIILS